MQLNLLARKAIWSVQISAGPNDLPTLLIHTRDFKRMNVDYTDITELKDHIMLLINDRRTTEDICEYIYGPGHGPNNPTREWEAVRQAVHALIDEGDIVVKFNGALLDFWR